MDPLRQRFLRREDRLGSAYAASSSPSRASRTNTTHWDGGRPSYEDYYEGIYADLESGSSSGRPSYSNRPSLEQPNRSSSSLMPLFPHGNMNTMSSQDESPADPTSRQDNTRAKGKATDNNTAKEKAPAIGQVLLQPEHIETITPERGFYGHKRYLWEWLPGTPDYKYLTAWITRFEVEFGDTMCQKVSYQMEDGEVIESAPSEWISGMLRTFSNEVVPIQNMVIIFAEGGVLDSDGSIAINNHVHRPIRQWVPSIESTATFNRADLSNIGDNTLVIDMSLNLDALTAIHRAGKKPAGIFKMIMHQADRRSFNIERHFNWRHNLDFASRLRSHATFGRQKVPANNLYRVMKWINNDYNIMFRWFDGGTDVAVNPILYVRKKSGSRLSLELSSAFKEYVESHPFSLNTMILRHYTTMCNEERAEIVAQAYRDRFRGTR